MTDEAWRELEAEIQRRFAAAIEELVAQGKTIYDQQIDPDDTSIGAPELWCIVKVDVPELLQGRFSANELVQGRMSDDDVAAFLARNRDWEHVWNIHDEIQDEVRESWPA